MNVRKLWRAIVPSPNDSLNMATLKTIGLTLLVIVLTSCAPPSATLKPGEASMSRRGTNVSMVAKQSEDAAAPATQEHTVVTESTYFPTNFPLLSNRVVLHSKTTDTMRTTIGEAQDNTKARSIWAKGLAAAEDTKAFMAAVKWLPLLGLLPLGLLVFSFTAYGKAMALSKEGRMALGAASLFLFVAPAISKGLVDNALILIICTVGGLVGYYLYERKQTYKVEAALRTPPPTT